MYKRIAITTTALLALIGLAMYSSGAAQKIENEVSNMSDTQKNQESKAKPAKLEKEITELATFGAGCFWGIEETYRTIDGVVGTAVGYMGGAVSDPTYKEVCYENTGHAEVAQIEFDPTVISYEELLEVFWKVHDPTQVNRQGPDVGDQYRTAIFYHSDEQKQIAEKSKLVKSDSGIFERAIATEISAAGEFWIAEEYHQKYLQKRGLPACKLY